jgi:hypothetical protein
LLLAVGIVTYQLIATYAKSVAPLTPEAVQLLTLSLVSVFVVDSAIDRARLTRVLERVANRPRNHRNNRFASSLSAHCESLTDGIDSRRIEFTNRYDSMAAILRLIDCSQHSYQGVNYYLGGWATDMSDFFAANLAAIARGVSVKRYFVVQRALLEDASLERPGFDGGSVSEIL